MLYIAVFIFFTAVFIFAYGVLYSLNYDKIRIRDRIEQIKDLHNTNRDHTENRFFSERILTHFYNVFCDFLIRITPNHKLTGLNKKLERAGLLKNGTVERWLFNKCMIMLISAISTGLLSYIIEPDISKAFIIAIIIMLLVNTFLNFSLSRRFEMRKKMILKDLPYTLDLITVSVEAGASFDGAMARVVNNISGALCDEFAKCLKEMKMGIERKTALKNMSERCDVKELSMLVNSLIQADELGVGLARVLRIEAANLREHRKQVARERAMKAPVKMLFPLIFFIFPSIFIIVLGPAIIKIFSIFK
ncbi:MAG: type II secretion system F family protein [Firmicutes bacterium]|nr:type II secretion system F family protein [Bacillota bacterium]